jgi:hypothetical protein
MSICGFGGTAGRCRMETPPSEEGQGARGGRDDASAAAAEIVVGSTTTALPSIPGGSPAVREEDTDGGTKEDDVPLEQPRSAGSAPRDGKGGIPADRMSNRLF